MSKKNIVIDASVSAIEEYIDTCDRIIADLEGENGLKQFEAVDREINNNLDGEYKDAFSDSVLEAKMSYLDSIANVYALRTVLQIYANFLNNGSGGKLTSTSDKKKVDMKSIFNQINKLEEAIESRGLVKSVLKNDDYFASWYRGYENSLNDSFFHTYTVDSYGNLIDDGLFAQRSHNEAVFKNNREVYKDLVSTLDYGLASTSSLVTELQAISGILSGQLSNFEQIWDVFEFTKSDYQNYLIAHYDGITRSNIEEQMNRLRDFIPNLDAILNAVGNYSTYDAYKGEGDDVDALEIFLNQYVDLSQNDRVILHDALIFYIRSKEKEIYTEYFNGNTDLSDLWIEYAQLKGLEKLINEIDKVIIRISSGNEQLIDMNKYNIELYPNFIIFKEGSADLILRIEDISVPPLTPSEIDLYNALNEYNNTTFGSDMAKLIVGTVAGAYTGGIGAVVLTGISVLSVSGDYFAQKGELQIDFLDSFGLIVDEKGNIEFTLYSLLMLGELAERYVYETDNDICSSDVCIKNDIEILLDDTDKYDDKAMSSSLKNLTTWAEECGDEINTRLGKTYE